VTHKTQNFELHAGNDTTLKLAVKDQGGVNPLDLTGTTVAFRLAASQDGVALIAKDSSGAEVTITDAAQGLVDVILTSAETAKQAGTHYYEAVVTDGVGNVFTVLEGQIEIDPAIGATSDDGEQATKRQHLTEAKGALHQLLTGKRVVEVDYDGRAVKYSKADIGQLRSYITTLEADLGIRSAARRAQGIWF
jgi:hypothetical protein